MNGRRLDLFAIGALAVQALLAFFLRTIAWPEVTTPAYLWSKGLLPYRDIKFVHTPGLMGVLALCFAVLGVSTWVLRVFALAFPLLAHALLLRETKAFSLGQRGLASAFFLVLYYDWQGNSVWPSMMICALALPIASSLSRHQPVSAGLAIGTAILIKQTCAFLLLTSVGYLLLKRRFREALILSLGATLPYAAAALAFAAQGAFRDYVQWTLFVPFTVLRGAIDLAPSTASLFLLVTAFLPLVLEALLERSGQYEIESRWLLAVAIGLGLMAYPRFGFLNLLASVPCLALGAGRLLRRTLKPLKTFSWGLVATIVLSRGAVLFAGEPLAADVLFWDDDPTFNRLVARLRKFPADTPLYRSMGQRSSAVWAASSRKAVCPPLAVLIWCRSLPWGSELTLSVCAQGRWSCGSEHRRMAARSSGPTFCRGGEPLLHGQSGHNPWSGPFS